MNYSPNYNIKPFKKQVAFLFILFLVTGLSLNVIRPANATEISPADQQKIADLQKQIDALQKEADQYTGNIQDAQSKAVSLKNEISILQNQISKIQTQIQMTSKNIDKTGVEIQGIENNIFDTQKNIDYKKTAIGVMLNSVYQQDADSLLTLLLKNRNLSDFLKRNQEVADINNALIDIVDTLKKDETDLEHNQSDLENKKQQLEDLNKQQKEQQSSLNQTKTGKNTLLTETKGEEAKYQKMLKDVEAEKTLFFTQLKEIETKVIQGGLYILHVQAQNLPKKGTNIFAWPESGYHLTQSYGCTSYARCGRSSGAYGGSPHNGIDMAAGYGSPIKAIGDGTIIANGKNDGWGNWVSIQHPPYNLVSLYAHMSAFEFLQVGTQVKSGETIGYEGNTGNAEGSHLHLSIYKDFFTYIKDSKGQLYFNYFEGTINPLDYLP